MLFSESRSGLSPPNCGRSISGKSALARPALYDRVNALLKASSEEPDFLESPATGVGATIDLTPPPSSPAR